MVLKGNFEVVKKVSEPATHPQQMTRKIRLPKEVDLDFGFRVQTA